MVLADELRGIFVTTAHKFSPQATAAAALAVDRNAVEYIDLVDTKRLLAVCDLAAKKDTNLWEKVKSSIEDLPRHASPGSNAFLDSTWGIQTGGLNVRSRSAVTLNFGVIIELTENKVLSESRLCHRLHDRVMDLVFTQQTDPAYTRLSFRPNGTGSLN